MKQVLIIVAAVAVGIVVSQRWLGEPDVVISSGPVISSGNAIAQIGSEYTGAIHKVKDGESIQDVVKRAQPGDTILVYPGTYRETIYIDKDNIRLSGVIQQGQWPIMEGDRKLNDAVLYSGNGITVENLKIQHFKGNAIMGQAGNNYVIRNNWIDDTGVYGIFPQLGKNGLVEYNVLRGIEDAAIYVGMCDNVVVRHNEVFENVAGIEIENTRHAIVENNMVYNNAGGILAFVTPGLPIKTTQDVIIRNNFVVANNHKNFGAPGSIVSMIPAGSGIVVMAADDVIIENNIIRDNKNAGIVFATLDFISKVANDTESDPTPDRPQIYHNFMTNNGYDPIQAVKDLMTVTFNDGGVDVVDIGSADGCIVNPGAYNILKTVSYSDCTTTSTADLDYNQYLSATPVESREKTQHGIGRVTYWGVCAGCHAYNVRMIGPATQVVQALYMDNPRGISEYINAPHKVRPDYPEMPPQNYLDEETRLAVAEYMLQVTK